MRGDMGKWGGALTERVEDTNRKGQTTLKSFENSKEITFCVFLKVYVYIYAYSFNEVMTWRANAPCKSYLVNILFTKAFSTRHEKPPFGL